MNRTPPFKVYTCEQWGAVAPRNESAPSQPEYIVVHHMVWPNRTPLTGGAEFTKAKQTARECQRQHMQNNGWGDTGQHWTLSRGGFVMEGRHGSLDAALAGHGLWGAHAADPDTRANANNSWGIECEGEYTDAAMPAAQWNRLVELCAWLCYVSNIDTANIVGHRDTGCATACPGNWLHAQLPKLRKEAHALKLKIMGRK